MHCNIHGSTQHFIQRHTKIGARTIISVATLLVALGGCGDPYLAYNDSSFIKAQRVVESDPVLKRDIPQAVATLETLLKKHPNNDSVLASLGRAYLLQGREAEGRKCIDRAQSLICSRYKDNGWNQTLFRYDDNGMKYDKIEKDEENKRLREIERFQRNGY